MSEEIVTIFLGINTFRLLPFCVVYKRYTQLVVLSRQNRNYRDCHREW